MTPLKRILYIEDNSQNMRLVQKYLRMGGYDMLEAATGEQGIVVAQHERPDLILLDINLPDVDGITIAGILKTEPLTQNIPIIALTANAMHGDRERFLAAGCNSYLSKPVSKTDLLNEISALIGVAT
ncbi:MAG: response regulator [Phototrophicaceae bacterium]|jgi:CheY-like chemotaxis protein